MNDIPNSSSVAIITVTTVVANVLFQVFLQLLKSGTTGLIYLNNRYHITDSLVSKVKGTMSEREKARLKKKELKQKFAELLPALMDFQAQASSFRELQNQLSSGAYPHLVSTAVSGGSLPTGSSQGVQAVSANSSSVI